MNHEADTPHSLRSSQNRRCSRLGRHEGRGELELRDAVTGGDGVGQGSRRMAEPSTASIKRLRRTTRGRCATRAVTSTFPARSILSDAGAGEAHERAVAHSIRQ
jgi:hypothetical protein